MLDASVQRYLEDRREDLLAGLQEFLRFPSIANIDVDPAGQDPCRNCAEWVGNLLDKMGFEARLIQARGKPHVFARRQEDPDLPTVLVYGHYDVQPPDPVDQWDSDPFEPVIRDGAIFARGANDNKGQFWAHICAMQAWLATHEQLPVNVKVFVEGEEEIGSPGLEAVLIEHKDLLAADYCLVSDSEFYDEKTPAIAYALRGIAAWQIRLTGPSADLHSGLHGGPVVNPIGALARLVAGLHDAAGRVTLPGFYDDVIELTESERAGWQELPFDESEYAQELGLELKDLAGGERDYSVLERRWGRPTLDANGIVGGYTQEGIKTVIPSTATVKVSTRLVPNQIPERIGEALQLYVERNTPTGCRAEIQAFGAGRPVRFALDSPAMRAGRGAIEEAFGRRPALIGCGASVPVTELFQRILGIDAVMLGYGLPSDQIHSPNERFRLDQLFGGAHATAAFLQRIGP